MVYNGHSCSEKATFRRTSCINEFEAAWDIEIAELWCVQPCGRRFKFQCPRSLQLETGGTPGHCLGYDGYDDMVWFDDAHMLQFLLFGTERTRSCQAFPDQVWRFNTVQFLCHWAPESFMSQAKKECQGQFAANSSTSTVKSSGNWNQYAERHNLHYTSLHKLAINMFRGNILNMFWITYWINLNHRHTISLGAKLAQLKLWFVTYWRTAVLRRWFGHHGCNLVLAAPVVWLCLFGVISNDQLFLGFVGICWYSRAGEFLKQYKPVWLWWN